jgi:DNA-binding Lrp family transcriptional regulator
MTTSAGDDQLDALDRELHNAVQWDFPLESRPFAVLGERLDLSEPAVRERVARVKELGAVISAHPGVCHNDKRNHRFTDDWDEWRVAHLASAY